MQLTQSNKSTNQEERRYSDAKDGLFKGEGEVELGALHAWTKVTVLGKVAWPVCFQLRVRHFWRMH